MSKDIFASKRKSYIEIGEVFFWTATINQWQKLMLQDEYKEIIINPTTHAGGNRIEIISKDLHKVLHQRGASELRNAK